VELLVRSLDEVEPVLSVIPDSESPVELLPPSGLFPAATHGKDNMGRVTIDLVKEAVWELQVTSIHD
jgi:hypothetical protein